MDVWVLPPSTGRKGRLRLTKLKVYGGEIFFKGNQERVVVAAHSQKEVARITGESLYYVRGYWCETGNPTEIEKASAAPGELVRMNPGKNI